MWEEIEQPLPARYGGADLSVAEVSRSGGCAVLRVLLIAILLGGTSIGAADDSQATDEVLRQAAAVILDDSVSKERREETIARHSADAARLLRQLTDGLTPETPEELRRIPWIWRVTVAAGKRNETHELGEILDASLPEPDGTLTEWQAVVIGGGVINGIGLAGAWPAERIEAVLKKRPELRPRWQRALDQSVAMAKNEKIIPGTRYDALRMIALLEWTTARPILVQYLNHENAELQQGAVSGLGDVQNDEAARLLIASLARLTESNRQLALEALVREESRRKLLRKAIGSGSVEEGVIGEKHLRRVQEK